MVTICLSWLLTQRGAEEKCAVHEFHGGSPNGFGAGLGSCQCGRDTYCVCTPSLAIDAIVEINSRYKSPASEDVSILLVVRKDSHKKVYAIPGGFVNVGETVENAVLREVHEETNLILDETAIHQYRTVSDPKRDHRRHTVSVVFRCITDTAMAASVSLSSNGHTDTTEGSPVVLGGQTLRGGDDARAVEVVPLRRVLALNLAFDHRRILQSYIEDFHPSILLEKPAGHDLGGVTLP